MEGRRTDAALPITTEWKSTAIGPVWPDGAALSLEEAFSRSLFSGGRGSHLSIEVFVNGEVQSSVGGGKPAVVEGLLMGQPSALSVQAVDTNGLRTLHLAGDNPGRASGSETPT